MSWLQLLKLNRHLVTGQLAAPAAEQLILVFCEHFHLAFPPPTPADDSDFLGTHLELTLVFVACFGLHRELWGSGASPFAICSTGVALLAATPQQLEVTFLDIF